MMEMVMAEKVLKAAEKADELTPVQKLAKLDQDRAKLDEERVGILASAKSDALQKATDAVEELNALGFRFRLVEGDEPAKSNGAKRTPADKPCEICQLKTQPFHDKRSHRKHPSPFTAEEIAAKGWTVVQ